MIASYMFSLLVAREFRMPTRAARLMATDGKGKNKLNSLFVNARRKDDRYQAKQYSFFMQFFHLNNITNLISCGIGREERGDVAKKVTESK